MVPSRNSGHLLWPSSAVSTLVVRHLVVVPDPPERQSVGRRNARPGSAVSARQQMVKPTRRLGTSPDLYQRRHQAPDHLRQETVRDEPKLDQLARPGVARSPPLRDLDAATAQDRPYRSPGTLSPVGPGDTSARSGESREIVLADSPERRVGHHCRIQRTHAVPDVPAHKRVSRSAPDAVTILAPSSIEASMKAIRPPIHRHDGHVRRQAGVPRRPDRPDC